MIQRVVEKLLNCIELIINLKTIIIKKKATKSAIEARAYVTASFQLLLLRLGCA